MVEQCRGAVELLWIAIHAVARFVVSAVWGLAQIVFDVATHKQIQVAVAVIIHPGGAAAPPTAAHSGLGRYFTEGTVAIVAEQLIAAVAGDVDIQVAVVVVVTYGHAGREHPVTRDARFGGYIREFPVAQIAVEHVARRWFAMGQVGSVREE